MTNVNVGTVSDIKRALIGAHVTLNGRDAIISDALVCCVRTCDGVTPGFVGKWSWLSAWRIVNERGSSFTL